MYGLILSYFITVVSSIAALRYPLIGLYAYVGFAVLRPQFIFSFAGDLSNLSLILGIAMLIGWAINGFGQWRLDRSRPVVLALFAYTGWYTLSAALAGNTDASFKALLELLKIVAPFCVGLTMIREERQCRPLLWIVVLAQGYVGFEMNLNYLRGYNSAAEGFGGMDNNCFGVSLVTVLGVAIALTMTSRKWYEQATSAACAALILHTTLLTFSRGAMVGLIVVGLTAVVLLPKRPKYVAVMVVVFLVALRFTGPQLMARYSTVFASSEERDGSAQSRLDLWADTLQVIQQRPLLGVGPANWQFEAATFGWSAGKSAHSVWMETAAEVGVPGALALLFFFGVAAARLWPVARTRLSDENRFRIGAAMAVVLAVAGFASAGQFVSVVGLEAPYYVVMIGAVVLKWLSEPVAATAAQGIVLPAGQASPNVLSGRPAVAKRSPSTTGTAAARPTRRLLPRLDISGPRT